MWLNLKANEYLLLGIPLTILFQVFVRRLPLRGIWLRTAPSFRLDKAMILVASSLMIIPFFHIAEPLRKHDWVMFGMLLSCLGGAFAAAYALRHLNRATLRYLLLCLASSGSFGISFLAFDAVMSPHSTGQTLSTWALVIKGGETLLLFFPIAFILEEVVFRGVLDAHLHQTGESRAWLSALFISVLWGLWHFPITPADDPLIERLSGLLIVHCAVGVPLSLYWRLSGNLAVPAATHAFIDTVRDILAA